MKALTRTRLAGSILICLMGSNACGTLTPVAQPITLPPQVTPPPPIIRQPWVSLPTDAGLPIEEAALPARCPETADQNGDGKQNTQDLGLERDCLRRAEEQEHTINKCWINWWLDQLAGRATTKGAVECLASKEVAVTNR